MTAASLKLLPLFRDLPEADLQRLAAVATWQAYGYGDYVIQPDDPRDDVFVFVQGTGRLSASPLGRPEVNIFLLSPGDVIDLNALPPELEEVVYVTVTGEQAIVCRLPRDLLEEVLFGGSPGAGVLDAQRNSRVVQLLALLLAFVYRDALGRLSHVLADTAQDDPEHMVWETHEELARRIGTQREVVTKLLQPLKRRGLIDFEPHYHGIKVLDVERLADAERGQ